jgi:hypothetical protein
VYVGSQITGDAECKQDIKRRSMLASTMVGKLNKIWRSPCISLAVKTLVTLVFMYGSECLKLRKCDEKISAIEMNWLRRLGYLNNPKAEELICMKQTGTHGDIDMLCARI